MQAGVVETRIDSPSLDAPSPDMDSRVPYLGLASRDASNSHGLATSDLNLPSFSILDTREFSRSGFDESMRVSTTRASTSWPFLSRSSTGLDTTLASHLDA